LNCKAIQLLPSTLELAAAGRFERDLFLIPLTGPTLENQSLSPADARALITQQIGLANTGHPLAPTKSAGLQ